jgi:hypothetical protein
MTSEAFSSIANPALGMSLVTGTRRVTFGALGRSRFDPRRGRARRRMGLAARRAYSVGRMSFSAGEAYTLDCTCEPLNAPHGDNPATVCRLSAPFPGLFACGAPSGSLENLPRQICPTDKISGSGYRCRLSPDKY